MVETTELMDGEFNGTTMDARESSMNSSNSGEQGSVDLQTPTPVILFVDDDERILNLLERSYKGSDWVVMTALSGNDGLRILSQHRVDIVVSDAKMPGMDGVEFLGRLAREYPEVTCLLMSGYMDIDDTINAINAGHIYGYVAKPWENDQLKRTIDDALQHARKRAGEIARLKEAHERGEKLRKEPISSIMDAYIITVEMDDPVKQVQHILDLGMQCVPVVDSNKKCFGVVSATDLVRFNKAGMNTRPEKAWEVCSHNVVSVDQDTSIEATCRMLSEKKLSHIVVTKNDRLVGLISTMDMLSELL